MTNIGNKSWCFTIYPENREDPVVETLKAIPCKRIICGFEDCPSTGRLHIQGAIIFSRAMRMLAVKQVLGGEAHLETMKGKWEDQDYCLKDGDLIRMEDNSKQGARVDVGTFRESMKRKPTEDLLEMPEEKLRAVARFPKLYNSLKMAVLKKKTRPFRRVEVHVHWGDADTGKTRKPYEEGAYIFDDYKDGWWDGYDGESVILLDDFYGGIKWSFFLRLLDGYQCRLKVKGGFTYAEWTKIYITSNKHPSEWYKIGMPPELKRRITNIVHFSKGI